MLLVLSPAGGLLHDEHAKLRHQQGDSALGQQQQLRHVNKTALCLGCA
jgi:hypothetical protein